MFGVDDAIGAVSGLFKTVVDKFVPDANAKIALQQAHDAEVATASQQAAAIAAQESQADVDLLKKQLDVNIAQASNANIFISGPRPFAMWASGVAVIAVLPLAMLCLIYAGKNIGEFFAVYTSLMAFAAGLFGIHTLERHKGVAPEQPDGPNVPAPFSISRTLSSVAEQPVVAETGKIFPRA
jgi:hypothetical protein